MGELQLLILDGKFNDKTNFYFIEKDGDNELTNVANSTIFNDVNEQNIMIPNNEAAEDPIVVEESLSLFHHEKKLIEKSLIKHKGKRKNAAAELGISERTLYRKLKEFGL